MQARLSDNHVIAAAAFAASIAFAAPSIHAQEQHWYIGGSLGQSKVNIDESDLNAQLTSAGISHTGFSSDEKDTAWKFFVGYRFNRNFALEGGYVDLGKWSASTTVTAISGFPPFPPLPTKIDFKTKEGLHVAAVGILPFANRFSVFGKLGGYSIKTEATINVAGASENLSDRGQGLLWGIGAGYDFSKQFGVRLEFEQFQKVGDKDKTFEGDVRFFSAGVVYRF